VSLDAGITEAREATKGAPVDIGGVTGVEI
jgi:hypothetical protein